MDGESTKKDGNKKLIADWLKTNKNILKEANVRDATEVSSYALVVDVVWKSAFATVRGKGQASNAT